MVCLTCSSRMALRKFTGPAKLCLDMVSGRHQYGRVSPRCYPPTVNHRRNTMFARMIELTAKAGRGKELTKTMAERSLQVLRQQQGFVDAFTLVATTDQDRIVGISIWNSKADADRFAQG